MSDKQKEYNKRLIQLIKENNEDIGRLNIDIRRERDFSNKAFSDLEKLKSEKKDKLYAEVVKLRERVASQRLELKRLNEENKILQTILEKFLDGVKINYEYFYKNNKPIIPYLAFAIISSLASHCAELRNYLYRSRGRASRIKRNYEDKKPIEFMSCKEIEELVDLDIEETK